MPSYSRKHQLMGKVVYHVWNRANRRLDIFHDHEDHMAFYALLKRYIEETETLLYHYCVMTNHYHFLLEIPEPEMISSMMAGIQRLYTMYYHKRYGTSGFLWQGRFGLKPIQKDTYLQRCGAYIELNPVRANITETPEEYKYSSARHYVLHEENLIVTKDPLYANFGETDKDRQNEYRKFLYDVAKENSYGWSQTDTPLGDADFKSRLMKNNGRWVPKRKGKRKAFSTFSL
jgi:putative transposase